VRFVLVFFPPQISSFFPPTNPFAFPSTPPSLISRRACLLPDGVMRDPATGRACGLLQSPTSIPEGQDFSQDRGPGIPGNLPLRRGIRPYLKASFWGIPQEGASTPNLPAPLPLEAPFLGHLTTLSITLSPLVLAYQGKLKRRPPRCFFFIFSLVGKHRGGGGCAEGR